MFRFYTFLKEGFGRYEALTSQEDSWSQLPRKERRKTMAEVLVRGGLKQRHIKKVWVQQPSTLQTLAGQLSSTALSCCQVDSQNTLFYP